MMIPDPGVLDRLIQDRQHDLRPAPRPAVAAPLHMRVRIGRMLIAAGSTLSGERVELPAGPPVLPHLPHAAT